MSREDSCLGVERPKFASLRVSSFLAFFTCLKFDNIFNLNQGIACILIGIFMEAFKKVFCCLAAVRLAHHFHFNEDTCNLVLFCFPSALKIFACVQHHSY